MWLRQTKINGPNFLAILWSYDCRQIEANAG